MPVPRAPQSGGRPLCAWSFAPPHPCVWSPLLPGRRMSPPSAGGLPVGRSPPWRRPPFPGVPGCWGLGPPRRCGGRRHPWLWMVAGGRCQRVPLRAPRGSAAEGPWVSPHPCRARQSPVVPFRISSSPVPPPCPSVLDLYHTYPFPPQTRRQVTRRTASPVLRRRRLLLSPGAWP